MYSLSAQEMDHKDDRIVILSNVYLDSAEVMTALRTLFTGVGVDVVQVWGVDVLCLKTHTPPFPLKRASLHHHHHPPPLSPPPSTPLLGRLQ